MVWIVASCLVLAWLGWVHGTHRSDSRLLAVLLGLDALVAFLAITATAERNVFESWMQEDRWAEWMTTFAFLGAGALAGRAALSRWSSSQRLEAAWLAGVALFCLAVAGEEVSWGQRLFGFKPPDVFLERNYQQELNVHNLLKNKSLAGLKLDTRYLVAFISIVYGVVLPLAAGWKRLAWLHERRRYFAPLALSPLFAAVAVGEWSYPVELAGEACELVLGCLFLAHQVLATERILPALAGPALVVGAPLLLGLATPLLTDRVLFGSDEERAAIARAELEAAAADLQRAPVVNLWKRGRVHKRIYTAAEANYFRMPEDAAYSRLTTSDARGPNRRQYFLDPWNNSYWIYFERKTGRTVLYSFGPNRRRDSRLQRRGADGAPRPDDVAVTFMMARPVSSQPEPPAKEDQGEATSAEQDPN